MAVFLESPSQPAARCSCTRIQRLASQAPHLCILRSPTHALPQAAQLLHLPAAPSTYSAALAGLAAFAAASLLLALLLRGGGQMLEGNELDMY